MTLTGLVQIAQIHVKKFNTIIILRHVASFLKGADLSKTLTCITIPISKILIRRGRGNTYNLYALQLMILFISLKFLHAPQKEEKGTSFKIQFFYR